MQSLAEPSWALGTDALVVFCKSQAEARSRVLKEYGHWAELAARFCKPKAALKYPKCRQPFEILASASGQSYQSVLVPQIHSANLPITPAVLRALDKLAENPDAKYFLSRVSPDLSKQIQIAATESTQSLIIGATPQQSIGRNRSDFWLPSDLLEFNRDVVQRLSVGRTMPYSYVGCSPVTKANWRRFTSEVTCIEELPDRSTIQLCQNFNCVPVATPVLR